eukprot:2963742-Pleurochrysis_carterae.AAC.1
MIRVASFARAGDHAWEHTRPASVPSLNPPITTPYTRVLAEGCWADNRLGLLKTDPCFGSIHDLTEYIALRVIPDLTRYVFDTVVCSRRRSLRLSHLLLSEHLLPS